MINLYQGDCLEVLKSFPDNSVEAVVTDPPYGLAFMNKKWDYDVPSTAIWKEVLRVLKPGGHLLSFGGTRTYHRMVVNIEDAGFEIRDQIQWLYGSGFPKSLDISKAIDKQVGAEREPKEWEPQTKSAAIYNDGKQNAKCAECGKMRFAKDYCLCKRDNGPQSEAAKQWEGWGTALKPANEPIVLARKPLEKGLTVADNVLKWGVGGLNISASRIGTEKVESGRGGRSETNSVYQDGLAPQAAQTFVEGRFPANLILDETAAAMLDAQTGVLKNGGQNYKGGNRESMFGNSAVVNPTTFAGDSGGASRFFYVAKASKSERNKGCEGMPLHEAPGSKRSTPAEGRSTALGAPRQNHHPTVKPVKLMEYLVKLITPPNGIVLDPFMGSGTTGVACKNLEVEFVGIEREEAYVKIAKARTA